MAHRVVVLDTHAVVWWTQEPSLVSAAALNAIESAPVVLVPAIVFWEVALLVRKGRLALKRGQPPAEWAARVLAIPRVRSAPLTPEVAIRADGLEMYPDPADRFIVAEALQAAAPVVTKDRLMRDLSLVKTIW